MKKANMLSKLTGAHMAVLCEYNGDTYVYESDKYFSPILNNIRAGHRFGPDNFETVADRATTSYEDNTKVPFYQASLPPYTSSSSSSSSQPDEELPVVTLGSPFCPASPSAAAAINLNAKTESTMPIRCKKPYPLAVDFFGDKS
jgi:hypothetical protein